MATGFRGWLLFCVGIVGLVASLWMTNAPSPAKPRMGAGLNAMDSPDVAAIRAKLYEAEIQNYARLMETDRVKDDARPAWQQVWQLYLMASLLVMFTGLIVMCKDEF